MKKTEIDAMVAKALELEYILLITDKFTTRLIGAVVIFSHQQSHGKAWAYWWKKRGRTL